jgi:hypothetical protein
VTGDRHEARRRRRIRAEFTVLEQHIAYPLRPDGPEPFADSIGVGAYRVDLHPRVSGAAIWTWAAGRSRSRSVR